MSLTDTGSLSISIEDLRAKYDEISNIDEKLNAALGTESATKTAAENRVMESTESLWTKPVNSVVNQLQKLEGQDLVGFYVALTKTLKTNFGDTIKSYIDTDVEANKDQATTQVPQEEIDALTSERKTLAEQFKALRGILEAFSMDTANVPDPKKRTGKPGKRGKRAFKGWDFSINGEPLVDETYVGRNGETKVRRKNNLSYVNVQFGKEMGWTSVTDVVEWLTEQGVSQDQDTFSVQVGNNTLSGVRSGEATAVDDEEDYSDEDE